jgi:hypothetical protein
MKHLLAIVSCAALAGCASMATPKQLQVQIPATCEGQNAQRVSAPAMKAGDDALVVLARTRAALGMADRRIDATRACIAEIRGSFATGGVK